MGLDFTTLHEDTLKYIFSFFPLKTLLNVKFVCKKFNTIIDKLIIDVFFKENPHLTGASIDLIKQQRQIRRLVLNNLDPFSYKVTKISFKIFFKATVKKKFYSPYFLLTMNKLFIFFQENIEIIDLETGNRKKIKNKISEDICFPPDLSREKISGCVSSILQKQNSITYKTSLSKGETAIFDPQKPGIIFVCKYQVIHHNINFIVLYKNNTQIEIVDIKTMDILFSHSFIGLSESRLDQQFLLIMNKEEVTGIDIKNRKILFMINKVEIKTIEIIDSQHFIIEKDDLQICDCKTGKILYTLPFSVNNYASMYAGHNFYLHISVFHELSEEEIQSSFTAGLGKFVAYEKKNANCFYLINTTNGKIESKFKTDTNVFVSKIILNRLIILSETEDGLKIDIYNLETSLLIDSYSFGRKTSIKFKFSPLNLLAIGKLSFPGGEDPFILDLISGGKYKYLSGTRKNENILLIDNDYCIKGKSKCKKIPLINRFQISIGIEIHHLSKKS